MFVFFFHFIKGKKAPKTSVSVKFLGTITKTQTWRWVSLKNKMISCPFVLSAAHETREQYRLKTLIKTRTIVQSREQMGSQCVRWNYVLQNELKMKKEERKSDVSVWHKQIDRRRRWIQSRLLEMNPPGRPSAPQHRPPITAPSLLSPDTKPPHPTEQPSRTLWLDAATSLPNIILGMCEIRWCFDVRLLLVWISCLALKWLADPPLSLEPWWLSPRVYRHINTHVCWYAIRAPWIFKCRGFALWRLATGWLVPG